MSSNFISGWGKLWDRKTVTSLGGWVTQTYQLTLDRGGRRRQVRKKPAKKSSKQSFNSFFYNSHKFNSSSGFAKNTDSWNILQTCAEKPTSSGENRCNTAATWFFSFKIWNTEKNICWKNPVWTCSIKTIVVKKPKFRLCQMPNSRKAILTATSI